MNLQNGIMYDDLINLYFGTLGYCQKDHSSFWNLILIDRTLAPKELDEGEKELITRNRKPALYFENQEFLSTWATEKGYKKSNDDVWMFYESADIDIKKFDLVKKVTSEDDLNIFLKTFNDCYQKDDPQNPYGELGEYLVAAEEAWHKHAKSNRLEYFLVYKNGQPVAVSTLTNHGDIGYISNVGSLRSVRGEGYGKAATLFCVQKSRDNGATTQCLTTEEGNYPNEFYKRIGFAPKFSALLYSK